MRVAFGIALLLAAAASDAALLGRLPQTPGGTDYQAYYDTDLNMTWLADANYIATESFGVQGIPGTGHVFWPTAVDWITAMNAASYLGLSSWRLPQATDTGAGGCTDPLAYSATDCGWNVDLSTGELAHLFYATLGNVGARDTANVPTGCGATPLPSCLMNTGPFANIQSAEYWYGTEVASNPADAWDFLFHDGSQGARPKGGTTGFAWAVHDGDALAIVPVPGAVWMFGSALAALIWLKRRSQTLRVLICIPFLLAATPSLADSLAERIADLERRVAALEAKQKANARTFRGPCDMYTTESAKSECLATIQAERRAAELRRAATREAEAAVAMYGAECRSEWTKLNSQTYSAKYPTQSGQLGAKYPCELQKYRARPSAP